MSEYPRKSKVTDYSGFDGFRVRTSFYVPPTGNEPSFLIDPPVEGPENGSPHRLSFDTMTFGQNQSVVIRNGNMTFKTADFFGGQTKLTFYRNEPNGSETELITEFAPSTSSKRDLHAFLAVIEQLSAKALNPRYVVWNQGASSFSAEFSFDARPNETILGTGQHQDHLLNQKGQTIDLRHFKVRKLTYKAKSN